MPVAEHIQRDSKEADDVIEIRLSDILAFLKRSRRAMLLGAIVGGVIGAVYAFSLPNQYTSQITVLPELQIKGSTNLGNLGSLAGLAGIDVGGLGSGTDVIRPDLYPTVIQSVPFALSLFKKSVQSKNDKQPKLFEQYWREQFSKSIIGWQPYADDDETVLIGGSGSTLRDALQVSKAQEQMAKDLKERVVATYDKKSGILTISATMPDPLVSARVTSLSLDYLTDYVTTYRTEKARREVDFLAKQVATAKQRYQTAEYTLSAYRDRNRSVYLNTAKIEEQRIQAEFLLAQDLYNTLSKQAEMAKIKVQEETPIFKILEPAQIPLRKSGPKRSILVGAFIALGVFCTFCYKAFKYFANLVLK